MTAAQGLYAVGTDVATSAAGWHDVATIANTSFTANAKYLIFATACVRSNSSSQEAQMRLVHGTTPTEFTDALAKVELLADEQEHNIGWLYNYTQPATAELVKLQVQRSAAEVVHVEFGQIFALNLDDVGSDGTEYHWNEVTADYTTTSTPTAQASVTFTPNGTDDYLVIAVGAISGVSGTTSHMMSIHDSVLGATLIDVQVEGEDATNEIRSYGLTSAFTPSNASHTVSAQFWHETSAHTVLRSAIFVLNLNTFAQHAYTFDAAEEAPAATPSWTTTRTLAPTPDVTGDWFIVGAYVDDYATAGVGGDDIATRLQINASGSGLASNPNYGDSSPGGGAWDGGDEMAMNIFTLISLSSGASRTINLDVSAVVGTAARVQDRVLVAFSLELPAAGTEYTQSVSGTLTSSGGLIKQAQPVKTGSLTSAGALSKLTSTSFTGAMTPAGTLLKQAQKVLSGDLSSIVGGLTVSLTYAKSLAGTLTSAGELIKQAQLVKAGTLSTAGLLVKQTQRALTGDLPSAGTLLKQAQKILTGELTSAGVLSASKVALISLSGTLAPAGTLIKQAGKNLVATLTSNSVLVRQSAKEVSGTLTPTGNLVKQAQKVLAGTLTTSGVLTTTSNFFRSVAGTLSASGSVSKQAQRGLSATVTVTGTLVKQPVKMLAGTVSSAGALVKQTQRTLSGAVSSIVGALSTLHIPGGGTTYFQSVGGTLTSTGGLVKRIHRALSGLVDSSGGVSSATIPGSGLPYPEKKGRGYFPRRRRFLTRPDD